ncbi:DUF2894 domain-containing protein [Paraburkholderia denitrificans]|uniref:DUF2894 domain-containing protein n=1 Tax=Paraburkholderia denitrificans TaxID=694025 RepID=A0ABW0JAG4_9BURK
MNNDARDANEAMPTDAQRGADRLDPVRARFIEALERRAASQSGKARELLNATLSELIAQSSASFGNAESAVSAVTPIDRAPATGPLRELANLMTEPANGRARPSAPEMLDYFRRTWATVRTESQLRQSLVQVPQNAGPLNSSSLVHRALSLMRELSPGYLQHFLSYVDALSWMEQPGIADAAASKEPTRTASGRKSTRSKAR